MDILRHLRAGLLSVDFRILYHVSRFKAGLRSLLPLSCCTLYATRRYRTDDETHNFSSLEGAFLI
jgi:hypothetical protein